MNGRRAVLIAVLFFSSSIAFADVTGTWSGSLSAATGCSGSLSVVFDLVQSGSQVSGSLTATGPQDLCAAGSPTITMVVPFAGTVSGSTLSGTWSGSGNGSHNL